MHLKLEWTIAQKTYEQNLDIEQLLQQNEEIPFDSDPWFGINLLDIEAFRQYKNLLASQTPNAKEIYSKIIEQYETIKDIIIETFVDTALIHNACSTNISVSENAISEDEFEDEFANFIDKLKPYLHSRHPVPMDLIESFYEKIPTSFYYGENIKVLLSKIRYPNNNNNQKNNRSHSTLQKDRLRRLIILIAEKYSEKSKETYHLLRILCKKHNINDIYSYDFAKIAVCTKTYENYVDHISNNLSQNIKFAFENRLSFEHFQVNLDAEKIKTIRQYFPEVNGQLDLPTTIDEDLKKYLENYRCIAIMEFENNSDFKNMFALSGIELLKNNSSKKFENKPWFSDVSKALSEELSRLEGLNTYIFCEQNTYMRKYAHKDKAGTYTKLENFIYLKDDLNWFENKQDYSCCERKLIAKLEKEKIENKNKKYPCNSILWTSLPICEHCNYALEDYKNIFDGKAGEIIDYNRKLLEN